jgi:adenine phosphoribosyltransferase
MMDLAALIREVPDFPKKGIRFKDITTLLKDGPAFRQALDALAELLRGRPIDLVIGIESRGYIFAAPLAYLLGVGFVPVRKLGKLPAETISIEYELEYGTNTLEMHVDAVQPGQRVVIVDDLLATGGTVAATIELVERLGGVVDSLAFLVELTFLHGRDKVVGYDVLSVIRY